MLLLIPIEPKSFSYISYLITSFWASTSHAFVLSMSIIFLTYPTGRFSQRCTIAQLTRQTVVMLGVLNTCQSLLSNTTCHLICYSILRVSICALNCCLETVAIIIFNLNIQDFWSILHFDILSLFRFGICIIVCHCMMLCATQRHVFVFRLFTLTWVFGASTDWLQKQRFLRVSFFL